MIEGRPRESLVFYDNAIEVSTWLLLYHWGIHLPQILCSFIEFYPDCRWLVAWTLTTHSRSRSVVSNPLLPQKFKLIWNALTDLLFRIQEKGHPSPYGKQAQPGEHPQRYSSSQRVGWEWQALHLVRLPPASYQSRCRPSSWDARSEAHGASSPWEWHLPRERRTLRLVLRWDHQTSYSIRTWAWSPPPQSPWWDQDDHRCISNPLPVQCYLRYAQAAPGWAR